MVIYIDLLIILNLFVTYFLLLGTAVFAQIEVKRIRLILTALFGSITSLLIFIPPKYEIICNLLKFPLGAILVLISFGYISRRIYIKNTLIFFAVNFIFGGVIFLIWIFILPNGIIIKNGVLYMALSPLILIIGTIVSYFIIKIINIIFSNRTPKKSIYKLIFKLDKEEIIVNTLLDTGNKLTDPFSGLPVIVCEFNKLASLLPETLDKFFCDPSKYPADLKLSGFEKKVRLIPCNTVTGKSILPAFKPDNIEIVELNKKINGYIGVTTNKLSDGEYQAIMGNLF